MKKKMVLFGLIISCVMSVLAGDAHFERLLDEVAFEASDIYARLGGYKRLIEYAQRRELDAPSLERFIKALEATYRARDLNNRAALVGIQEVCGVLLRTEIFATYHSNVRGFLEKLHYDLLPFALRSGDIVSIEICGRNMFCATQQRGGEAFIHGQHTAHGRQLRLDCLFRVEGGETGKPITLGQVVQLQPLYLQQGRYILPPTARLGGERNTGGKRGAEGAEFVLQENGALAFTFSSPLGECLRGAPVVIKQGVHIVDTKYNLAWALPAGGTRLTIHPVGGEGVELFAFRTVKSQVVEQAHARLMKANVEAALKQPLIERRLQGLVQIFTAMRSGISTAEAAQYQEILQGLYEERKNIPPAALRSLEKLFLTVAHHPAFAPSKLVFEQYTAHAHDELCAHAVSFGEYVRVIRSDQKRSLQLALDESLAKQGHLLVNGEGPVDNRVIGQQCVSLASTAGKAGAINYGDEVTLTSYFVDDGRDGGLLACPVTWWVDVSPENGSVQRVLASGAAAVQTHSGQEIFRVQNATLSTAQGPVLAGDVIHFVSKYTGRVVTFGDKHPPHTFTFGRASKEQLASLADKRFRQYVQRVDAESDVAKKATMLGAALDLFKGQRLLSAQAGKVLYAALKRTSLPAASLPAPAALEVKQLLTKAQDAPFSSAAKKRFVLWQSALEPKKS